MRNFLTVSLVVASVLLGGCGGQEPPAQTATPAAAEAGGSAAKAVSDDLPAMRNFAAIKIGPYDVQPMFEEEIENGHYNIDVKGGEVKGVRIWVGPENAEGVVVVKTEIEHHYNHGHVEVPRPLPADAALWIEIENPAGETFKGSTPLVMAP